MYIIMESQDESFSIIPSFSNFDINKLRASEVIFLTIIKYSRTAHTLLNLPQLNFDFWHWKIQL